MRSDPIVDEVREVREAQASQFDYDLEAIFRDLQERESQSGRIYVSLGGDKSKGSDRATGLPRPASGI
jgi:hypothetical protein